MGGSPAAIENQNRACAKCVVAVPARGERDALADQPPVAAVGKVAADQAGVGRHERRDDLRV